MYTYCYLDSGARVPSHRAVERRLSTLHTLRLELSAKMLAEFQEESHSLSFSVASLNRQFLWEIVTKAVVGDVGVTRNCWRKGTFTKGRTAHPILRLLVDEASGKWKVQALHRSPGRLGFAEQSVGEDERPEAQRMGHRLQEAGTEGSRWYALGVRLIDEISAGNRF